MLGALVEQPQDRVVGGVDLGAQLGQLLFQIFGIDGSAFLNHVRLVRRARNAPPPTTLEIDPLVYQGGSGVLLGPRDDLLLGDSEWGLDYESEVAVILGDVPRGTTAAQAAPHVRL